METLITSLQEWFATERARSIGEAVLLLALGLVLARLVSGATIRLLRGRLTSQQELVVRRLSFYSIAGIAAVAALRAVGLDLSVFLGAAGILTIALGFASQTSASNLISGLFLLGERPFVVDDVIRVEETTGTVVSIDWLSVKLRTFDNLFVRIPNEALLKSQITNLTRFPIRRVDLPIGVAYKEDLREVFGLLEQVAAANPLCLDEPPPLIQFLGYGDSSLDVQFSVWVEREQWLEIRRQLPVEIKNAFDTAGIEIPFPHRSLYAGSVTEPFPVRVVDDAGDGDESGRS